MSRLESILNKETVHQLDEDSPLFEAIIRSMKIYAEQCVKASLEKASESLYDSVSVNWDFGDHEVDKESITNPENIVLL